MSRVVRLAPFLSESFFDIFGLGPDVLFVVLVDWCAKVERSFWDEELWNVESDEPSSPAVAFRMTDANRFVEVDARTAIEVTL